MTEEPHRFMTVTDWQRNEGYLHRHCDGTTTHHSYNVLYKIHDEKWVVLTPEWEEWLRQRQAITRIANCSHPSIRRYADQAVWMNEFLSDLDDD